MSPEPQTSPPFIDDQSTTVDFFLSFSFLIYISEITPYVLTKKKERAFPGIPTFTSVSLEHLERAQCYGEAVRLARAEGDYYSAKCTTEMS